MWEVHVQFYYDKKITAQFCFVDDEQILKNAFGITWIAGKFISKNISAMNFDNFDAIILLTKENIDATGKKIIRFAELEQFFIRRTYVEIPLLHFLQRYPKVKLFLTNFPTNMKRYVAGVEFYSQLCSFGRLKNIVRTDKNNDIETSLDKFGYTHEQINEIVEAPDIIKKLDGSTKMIGDDNKFLQGIVDGKRITEYQPEKFLNKIYFFGSCHHYGVNAPFDKTIESYLQKMLNKHGAPYRVENESQRYLNRYQDIFYNLNKINPMPGDIIFVWISNLRANNEILPFADISDAFDPPHDYKKVFCVKDHVNELGYKLVAEKYFKFLTENNFFRDVEFNYPIPPPRIIDMVYRLGSSRAA
ncbi:MAG: hypothetical protein IJK81_08540 [Selenomonadaceae bacterium]|nr:hypothetical protein [Selenomonadaceae bacterium]